MKKYFILLVFSVFIQAKSEINLTHITNSKTDSLSLNEKKLTGQYYPYWQMSEDLVNQLPIKIKMKPVITDLHSVGDEKKSTFYISMSNEIHFSRDIYNLETPSGLLDLKFEDFFSIIDVGIEEKHNEIEIYYLDPSEPNFDKNFPLVITHHFSGIFPFKWNLRAYPFDTQELVIEYSSQMDTSFVQLEYFEDDTTNSIHLNEFLYLQDGYTVEEEDVIDIIADFEIPDLQNFSDGKRNSVQQEHLVLLFLTRNGSFLYFKLFFGGILSLLISLLAFFVARGEFESKITLCLGSVFGAIGNKYFVESSMPDVQVLTKADLINNVIILLVIINIFIIVAQNSKSLNLGLLEKNRNAVMLIVSMFVISNILIIYAF